MFFLFILKEVLSNSSWKYFEIIVGVGDKLVNGL